MAGTIYDGFIGLQGMDGSLAPNLTPPNVSRAAVNCSFRGGIIKPRPGYHKRPVTFNGDAFIEDGWKNGVYQFSKTYYSDDQIPTILTSKGGRIFTLNPETYVVGEVTLKTSTNGTVAWTVPALGVIQTVTVADTSIFSVGETIILQTADRSQYGSYEIVSILSGTTMDIRNVTDANETVIYAIGFSVSAYDVNDVRQPRAWMEQAEKWMVIQDGVSKPLFYDGASLRRAIEGEIRTGKAMAYGNGRLWVAHPTNRFYFAGDLVFGSSGTAGEAFRDAVLKMQENSFLAGGGYFSVPASAGPIRAMDFPGQLDTSLGHGPLMVFCENMIFSCLSPTIRAEWFSVDQPLRTVVLRRYGAMGAACVVDVNSDLWFRSQDGIRSLVLSRRDFQGAASWSNTPQSQQVEPFITPDPVHLLINASGVNFDKRLLMTCGPQQSSHGIVWKGLISLDFEPIASANPLATKQDKTPQYDGVWTGLHAYQIMEAVVNRTYRIYNFSEDHNGQLDLYEITVDQRFDDNGSSVPMRILWSFETGSFPFNSDRTIPFTKKALTGGEIYYSGIYGNLDVDLKFRPDGYECWINWHRWQECAPLTDCVQLDFSACPTLADTKPQVRPYVGFPLPPNACDPATKRSLREFFRLQTRLQFRGYGEVVQCRFGAIVLGQADFAPVVCNVASAETLQ